jgi:hypothetical protein
MLPLIRASRPKRFEALNRLAYNFFQLRAKTDKNDLIAASEAIYHGLWLNKPLEEINRLWRDSATFDPRIEPDEFDRGSLANVFMRAKTRALLKPNEIALLPRPVALEWLDALAGKLLNDRRIEDTIYAVRTINGNDYKVLDERPGTASVLARLMYRAGYWNDAAQLALHHLDQAGIDESVGADLIEQTANIDVVGSRPAALLSLLRTWVTVAAKSGGKADELKKLLDKVPMVKDTLVRVEIAAHIAIAMRQAGDVFYEQGLEMKKVVYNSLQDAKSSRWKSNQRILRLAILVSGAERMELLEIWVEAQERVPRGIDSTVRNLLLYIFRGKSEESELTAIFNELQSGRRAVTLNALDAFWRRNKKVILDQLRYRDELNSRFLPLVGFDHSDWSRSFGNALTRELKRDEGIVAQMLDREDFRVVKNVRQRDGVAIVQTAADQGRLLELARLLEKAEEASLSLKQAIEVRSEYPQDVFDVAHALLQWHSTIEKFVSPNDLHHS